MGTKPLILINLPYCQSCDRIQFCSQLDKELFEVYVKLNVHKKKKQFTSRMSQVWVFDKQYMNQGQQPFSKEQKLKLSIIKSLLKDCNRKTKSRKIEDAARKLGRSKRTVRRLLKGWKERGLASLVEVPRADKGKPRKSEYWYNLVQRIYLTGNKGTYQMSCAEVFHKIVLIAHQLALFELKEEREQLLSQGFHGKELDLEVQKLIQAKKKAQGFRYWSEIGKPPSRRTVERWLKPKEENKRKTLSGIPLALPNHP